MSGGNDARMLGRWGEAVVAADLRRSGWKILASGFRCRMGEIDLIAEKDGFLAFIEVKLRKNADYGTAGAFVGRSKQHKLRAAAQLYLQRFPTDLQPRFDVAEVYAPQGADTEKPRIQYIENAF